jgi:hypothetical protein
VPFAYQTASCDIELTITGRSSGRLRDASLLRLSHMANETFLYDPRRPGRLATVRCMQNSFLSRPGEQGVLRHLDPSALSHKEVVAAA